MSGAEAPTADPGTADPGRRLDRLLGGRLRLWQPTAGYRVAIDPFLLAASLSPEPGEHLLELGCGSGAVSLCLLARHPRVTVVGLEVQDDLAALARMNARENGFEDRLEIRTGDLSGMPPDLNGAFDQVFFNPPYLAGASATVSARRQRATAHFHGDGALGRWFAAARFALRPGGRLAVIFRADRLDDLLAVAGAEDFGSFALQPLWPKAGQPARRLLLAARRGGRSPLLLHPGLVLHEADGRYTADAAAVLRGEAAIPLHPPVRPRRAKAFAQEARGAEQCNPDTRDDPEQTAAKGEHDRGS